MANTYLTKTNSGTGSETKGTLSAWIKISELGDDNVIFHELESSGNYFSIKLKSGDFQVIAQNNSSAFINVRTDAVHRDVSGWYNFVVAIDSTQATASDRIKMYVNGVLQTSFSTATYPPQNQNCKINQNNEVQTVGGAGATEYFSGSMSHIHWVDGTAYAASTFGSTDSTTGEWEINTSPTLTYGTNGFFILKNGNSLTDESGNSNNFTLGGGTLTKTEDCPSNVFATMNPLDNYRQGSTFSNGNNTFLTADVSTTYNTSSIMVNTGKFYAECKVVSGGAATNIGIAGEMADATTGIIEAKEFGYAYASNGEFGNNGSASSYGSSYANGDIIGIALDCTNNKLYFSKNGTFQDSGNPSAGSGGKTITAAASTTLGLYAFAACDTSNGDIRTFSFNYGNGYFGTTAVSSAGTNASGNGIFEYDVPTGYTAISTKGLNV